MHLLTLAGPFCHFIPTAKTAGAIANPSMTAQLFEFKQIFRMSQYSTAHSCSNLLFMFHSTGSDDDQIIPVLRCYLTLRENACE